MYGKHHQHQIVSGKIQEVKIMGGRGSSSGISDKGKKYGTEYHTVAQFGEIK